LVAFYDIRPRNGTGQFLQLRNQQGQTDDSGTTTGPLNAH